MSGFEKLGSGLVFRLRVRVRFLPHDCAPIMFCRIRRGMVEYNSSMLVAGMIYYVL